MFTKQAILQKTLSVGKLTAISRILGMVREMLMVRYLGVGLISDVFNAAYFIPNSLRKIFAEGALTSAFVPQIVRIIRSGGNLSSIMTLSFLVFEGMVIALCLFIIWQAPWAMYLRAPGFSVEQLAVGTHLLRILVPLIFFLSSSSLLAGALHAIGNFGIPAFGPILLNIVFISTIMLCMWYQLPIPVLCFGILLGGLLLLIIHLIAYLRAQFSFGRIQKADFHTIGDILSRFFFSVIAMSTVEIKLLIDGAFASYLAVGSISLIYYAERFMGIPLGIFATSFATVLLPHLSRVSKEAPRRLSFYLLESFKLVFWVALPVMLFMAFLADKIFITLFMSHKFSLAHALQAGLILRVYLIGLFFYSINKMLHNFFFSLQATKIPAYTSLVSAIFNIILNVLMIVLFTNPAYLVLASNIAVCGEMIAMTLVLERYFGIPFALKRFMHFMLHVTLYTFAHFALFILFFYSMQQSITYLLPSYAHALENSWLFWLWTGPLLGMVALSMLWTRTKVGIDLYFLDK